MPSKVLREYPNCKRRWTKINKPIASFEYFQAAFGEQTPRNSQQNVPRSAQFESVVLEQQPHNLRHARVFWLPNFTAYFVSTDTAEKMQQLQPR